MHFYVVADLIQHSRRRTAINAACYVSGKPQTIPREDLAIAW